MTCKPCGRSEPRQDTRNVIKASLLGGCTCRVNTMFRCEERRGDGPGNSRMLSMSSLVEGRRDAADCSTRSTTMNGGGRHGWMTETPPRPVPVGDRVGALTGVDVNADRRGTSSSSPLCYLDETPSPPRLSLKQQDSANVRERSTDHRDTLATTAVDGVEEAPLQTGSRDSGSRNPSAAIDNASGEVRSRSADPASNIDDDDGRRSRGELRLPADGAAVEEPEVSWNDVSDERKSVFRVERAESTVDARCRPHTSDGAVRNATPRRESTEARDPGESSTTCGCGRDDVMVKWYVDEPRLNGSEDDRDSLKPSTTTASSSDNYAHNHVVSTCSAADRWSYGAAGNSDVTPAKLAGAPVDHASTTNLCRLISWHFR